MPAPEHVRAIQDRRTTVARGTTEPCAITSEGARRPFNRNRVVSSLPFVAPRTGSVSKNDLAVRRFDADRCEELSPS
jgi:hypothetical protein